MGSFSADLSAFAKATNRDVTRVYRGVILKLFNSIILDTPVDTGMLRANWQTTIGQPANGTRGGVSDEDREVFGQRQLTTMATGAATKEVKSVTSKATPARPLFLTNNLPYAERVEFDGWSHTKAPDGMVRKNMVRFEKLIKEQIRSLT